MNKLRPVPARPRPAAMCRIPLAVLLGLGATAAVATEVEDFVSGELRRISETPVQSALGTVIGQICPSGLLITDSDLQNRCDEIATAIVGNADPTDDGGARDALQAMAAEEDAVIASSRVDSRSGQIDAIGQRLTNLRGGAPAVANAGSFNWAGGAAGDGVSTPWGFFVTGTYASTDRDTTAREAGFEADDYGVTVGVDYNFDGRVVLGLAGGYNNSDADIDNNGGKLDTDSYSVFGYWSLYPDDVWFVDAMVGYTDNDHDQTRNVIYNIAAVGGGTTRVNNSAVSNTDSEEWSASISAGRDFALGQWVLTPLARFDYADVEIDAFTETMAQQNAAGAGLALAIDGQDFESMMVTAGSRLTTRFDTSFGAMFPEISAEYVHEFKNNNAPITGRFVNDSSNTTIVLLTDGPDRNFFNVGAGLTAAFNDNASGFVRYQGLFGYQDLDVHAVEIGIRATF